MLEMARIGEADYNAGGARRLSGLYQAVTSARTVTLAIQNMSGHVLDFDAWYADVREELKANPAAKYFHGLRNRIAHEADHGETWAGTEPGGFDTDTLFQNAPPGTESICFGDRLGRNGWRVRMPDGSIQDIYFTLPSHVGFSIFGLEDAPDRRDIGVQLHEYLDTLEDIVRRAESRFG